MTFCSVCVVNGVETQQTGAGCGCAAGVHCHISTFTCSATSGSFYDLSNLIQSCATACSYVNR